MTTVGVCFDEQITNVVPRDEYDRAVDIIVTNSKIWR